MWITTVTQGCYSSAHPFIHTLTSQNVCFAYYMLTTVSGPEVQDTDQSGLNGRDPRDWNIYLDLYLGLAMQSCPGDR
jgi:hypothetical protein